MKRLLELGLVALLLSLAPAARAHPLSPAGVELHETDGGRVEMTTRLPRRVRPGERPELRLPTDCEPTSAAELVDEPTHRLTRAEYRCAAPLAGRRVSLAGVAPQGTALVLRYRSEAGSGEWMLDWRHPSLRLDFADVGFASSLRLGVEHLLTGFDHALMVFGLTYLFGFRRSLFVALGAFTIGHATSLAFVLGLELWPPVSVVEGAILFTLVLLGLEIGAPEGGWSRRWSASLPFMVGLIHGCGFAGALREAGLASDSLMGILVPFHVGLEMAQLALVAAVALPLLLLDRAPARRGDADRLVAAFVGGAAIAMMIAYPS